MDRWYFLHIHKTAGMTFTAILESHFPREQVCAARQWHQLLSIPPDQLADYRLFAGHFHHCFGSLLPQMPIYLTFLRDPVERVLSRYAHLQRDYNHYLYAHMVSTAPTLREFLCHPLTRAQVHNLQVRTIAYDFDILALRRSIPGELTPAREMEAAVNRMFAELPDHIDDDLLAIALRQIHECAFVGITEQFDDSLRLLASVFGWQPTAEYQNRNVNPDRPRRDAIDADLIAEIEAINQADIALYREARRLFAARLQALDQLSGAS